MEPLEVLENPLTVSVVEADPSVSDVVSRDIILVLVDAEFDPSIIGRSRVLPCILEQVGQENPQKPLVPHGHRSRLCLEPQFAFRDPRPQFVDDLVTQR